MLVLLACAGCTARPAQTPDERLQQQAARGAEQLRHDLKDASKETKQALLQARRETRDVVIGAKRGWAEGGPSNTLDINRASLAQLETLPGVSSLAAQRIVAHRPYRSAGELERRGILTRPEYERIAASIRAN